MSRPLGITVIAIILTFSGLFRLLIGLEAAGITHFGLAPAMESAELLAVNASIAGVLTLIAAFGLFSLRSWAWYFAVIVMVIRVISNGFGLASYALSSVPGGVTVLDVVVSVAILWYLFRPQVKTAFNIAPMTDAERPQ
ncbi:MAG: hypothetical protein ACJ77F_16000 [Chloroflexota bacterium]